MTLHDGADVVRSPVRVPSWWAGTARSIIDDGLQERWYLAIGTVLVTA